MLSHLDPAFLSDSWHPCLPEYWPALLLFLCVGYFLLVELHLALYFVLVANLMGQQLSSTLHVRQALLT